MPNNNATGLYLFGAFLMLALLLYVPFWTSTTIINPGSAPEQIQTVFQTAFLIGFFAFIVLVIGSE